MDDVASKYVNGWNKTMITIWQEKIERLGVVRTGALHQSFDGRVEEAAEGATISIRFARYGIYQSLGVGYGYVHDNGGDLPFLGEEYRRQHRLDVPRKVGPKWGGYKTSGKPREPRDWYSKKLYLSYRAMVEDLGAIYADKSATVICDQLSEVRSALD